MPGLTPGGDAHIYLNDKAAEASGATSSEDIQLLQRCARQRCGNAANHTLQVTHAICPVNLACVGLLDPVPSRRGSRVAGPAGGHPLGFGTTTAISLSAFQPMSEQATTHAVVTLDASSSEDFIQHGIVLVGFSERRCGPCHKQLPILERVAERVRDRTTIALINVDEAPAFDVHFNIEAIPTLVLFKHGQVAGTFVGVHSETDLTKAILTVAETPVVDLPPNP